MFAKSILPVAAALAIAAPALSAPAAAKSPPVHYGPVAVVKADARIPFADHGGVQDWHPVGDREVWFQDRSRKWYRAVLMSPAFDLPFTEHVGIDSRPIGTLDRFGGVIIKGQTYRFSSFDLMNGPPPDQRPDLRKDAKKR